MEGLARGHSWGDRDAQKAGGGGRASRKSDRPDHLSHMHLHPIPRFILPSRGPAVRLRSGHTRPLGKARSKRRTAAQDGPRASNDAQVVRSAI
jgi:hypothetical protein